MVTVQSSCYYILQQHNIFLSGNTFHITIQNSILNKKGEFVLRKLLCSKISFTPYSQCPPRFQHLAAADFASATLGFSQLK